MLKLRHRILAGFILPVLITFVVVGLTWAGLDSIQESANEVTDQYELTVLNNQLLEATLNTEIGFRGYAITGDSAFLAPLDEGRRVFGEAMARLEMGVTDPDRLRRLASVSQLMAELQHWHDGVIAARRGDGSGADAAAAISGGAEKRYLSEIRQRIGEIKASGDERVREAIERRNASIRQVWIEVLIGALLGAALSLVATYVIAARITRPILGAVDTVSAISSKIVARVTENEQVVVHLATAVTQTTAAMEELAASSRQSADQAEHLAAGSRRVQTLADDGAATVEEMLRGTQSLKDTVKAVAEQILRLSEQTTQIGSITHVVSDLATQTNMLAINAAVEAARAGDHGKGFSVVAVEIRKLADQSRKAAERIATLVGDILKAMGGTVLATDEGTKGVDLAAGLAGRNADTFNSVSESITATFEGTQQISLNAKQQSLAINEVVHAMNDLQVQREETSALLAAARADGERLGQVADGLRAMV